MTIRCLMVSRQRSCALLPTAPAMLARHAMARPGGRRGRWAISLSTRTRCPKRVAPVCVQPGSVSTVIVRASQQAVGVAALGAPASLSVMISSAANGGG